MPSIKFKHIKNTIKILVFIMLLANCLIFMGAEHVAPEEMKKVIEEEKSVIIGSFKVWRGVRSKGQATLECGTTSFEMILALPHLAAIFCPRVS